MVCACSSGGKATQETVTAASPQQTDPIIQAELLVFDQEYTAAIKLLSRIIEDEGPTAYALTLRGISYAKMNLPYPAFADLVEATRIYYSVETLMNVGNAERMFGFCERAADAFRKASALQPNDYQILNNLASAYLCYGKIDLGLEALQEARKHHANDEILLTNLAIAHSMKQNFEEARRAVEDALRLNGSYMPAHRTLYQICVKTDDLACAQKANAQYESLKSARPRRTAPRKQR